MQQPAGTPEAGGKETNDSTRRGNKQQPGEGHRVVKVWAFIRRRITALQKTGAGNLNQTKTEAIGRLRTIRIWALSCASPPARSSTVQRGMPRSWGSIE